MTRTKNGKCQWSCVAIKDENWGGNGCATCSGLSTPLKKIIAALSGQSTGGHILVGMPIPEMGAFQEDQSDVHWSCHNHRKADINIEIFGKGWHKVGWGISMAFDHGAGNFEIGWYNNQCGWR